ncbi:hypothetical protein DL770_002589 [Monosporascus sp. CRB-9-2]|nr:hypothetical protein DL770_002589 [Monosporascus sp. CRB-9-2]
MKANESESQMLLARDATFEKVLHKESSSAVGMLAMVKKNHEAQQAASDDYFQHWDNKTAEEETEEIRTNDTKVLDVGCGVGGPAREISKFTGAHITGLNLNEYQIERAKRYALKQKMDNQVRFVQGNFMSIPFEDDTFDAVYAIEATVHAPSLEAVYSEIFRVLKPGGIFGVYEWVMTEKYDNDNLGHRETRIGIEQGDGIANMVKASEAIRAIEAAGFELLTHEDLAERPDPSPWYWPLDAGSWRHAQTLSDLLYTFRMTYIGRSLTRFVLSALETVRLAPPGMVKMSDSLCTAADALVLGGKDKIFTPMYLMIGRKPEQTKI